MSKRNKKKNNPKSYGRHGGMNGMGYAKRESSNHGNHSNGGSCDSHGRKANHKTAGLTVNINKLSLHMDERMTTTYDNHSFHPVDGSHYCGNEVTESNRYGGDRDHCGCGFHQMGQENCPDIISEFCGAPCIDMDEMAESISKKLKVDLSTVVNVLMAEDEYLEEKGLSIPLYEDDDDSEGDTAGGGDETAEGKAGSADSADVEEPEKEAENNGN